MMDKTAAVITVSDRGARGERIDTSGPALCEMLEQSGWHVLRQTMVPDEISAIKEELIRCADEWNAALVLTTGGTGFSPRDVTPEATLAVVERETPGIPEAMRAESMKITPRACLSRSVAGIRKGTLIINLPGSEKAARENLSAILDSLLHGVEMIRSGGSDDCAVSAATVRAVCISEQKGEQKHPVESIHLLPDHGIKGDAHAGNWHRQISLLGAESVAKAQKNIPFELLPGAFAENILAEGIVLYEIPVGTKIRIGTAVCEVTQIGKECHAGCAIRELTGDCVMPREGIFVKVLEEGKVRPGDTLCVMV
jgi:molybdenum cofactor synthesis domain-containing protein